MSLSTALPDDLAGHIRPLTRREYDRLVLEGAFEDEPIELLEGFLVEMSPEGSRHAYVIDRLNELLVSALAGEAIVRIAHPLGLGHLSEPEPDVAVVPRADYRDEHPTQALLVIESSASSRIKDLKFKADLYARHDIPEYWVVDLERGQVVVHRDPSPQGYRTVSSHGAGDTLMPLRLRDVSIALDDVLP